MNRDLFPLIRFLSGVAAERGPHVYVVGGAVRNFLMGHPIKDVDLVVDSVALEGYDSEAFARDICAKTHGTTMVTNQYGVAIVTMDGDRWGLGKETVEIATARKESYGGAEGKGYKPHMVEPATIEEDLLRREFTFNTLMWRLSNLKGDVSSVEVLDLLGVGRRDLGQGRISCPVDPDKTFTDDPTRMLRFEAVTTTFSSARPYTNRS
jgi:tRNA nucleotidyltransferase/poly(A) polymerase